MSKRRKSKRRVRNLIVGFIGAPFIRLWFCTIRYRCVGNGPPAADSEGRIFVMWHQRLIVFTYTHRGIGAKVLISSHGDGEMLTRIMTRLGFKAIRGSSTRRGFEAMRELIADEERGHDYAVVPDGPRGPARVFKRGPIYLASRTGLPLVPTTIAYSRFLRFRSWDGFMLPLPFSRATMRFGDPIEVPPGVSNEEIEEWRLRVEDKLNELTEETDKNFVELYKSSPKLDRSSFYLRRARCGPAEEQEAHSGGSSNRSKTRPSP